MKSRYQMRSNPEVGLTTLVLGAAAVGGISWAWSKWGPPWRWPLFGGTDTTGGTVSNVTFEAES